MFKKVLTSTYISSTILSIERNCKCSKGNSMKKLEEIYKKLDDMNLSMLARSVINSSDQYGILLFDGLDEVDVELLCEEIANDEL